MLCSKLLVAHVPHPNNLVYFHQRGIVNTLFVAGVCLFADFFLYSLTMLLIVVVALGLHVQIQHTQHSIIELCYLTCQIKSVFNASKCYLTCIFFDTQRPRLCSVCLILIIWSIFTSSFCLLF
jgi:hypothetical protein